MKECRWCGRKVDLPKGKLCSRCRTRADAGLPKPKADAMSRRLPGSFEGGRRR